MYLSALAALNGATIAFDLDGTLVESAPDLIGAVNAILIAEGLKPLADSEALPFISRGARWLLHWGPSVMSRSFAKILLGALNVTVVYFPSRLDVVGAFHDTFPKKFE